MAGETYTSFSFLGTAGWAYSYGAPILYLVAYLTVGLTVAYVAGPAIWTYARRHDLISIADLAEHRFRSRPVGMLVAVVATVFLVPYIQLQIQGMGVVVNAMSYGGVDLHVAAVVSFVVAEAFILVSGLRGSAWVSALKDVLVIFAVVFLAIYVPLHYVHGAGAFMDRMVTEKPEWLTFPGHDSGGRATAGRATALFVTPALKNFDLALFTLVTKALPHDPLYGVNAGVIGLVANLIVNACVSYARPDVRVRVAVVEEAS
jgi:SSS family solute:Na+ symporter